MEILRIWRLSGTAGLTNETFMACIQSILVVMGLIEHLTKQHGFQYVWFKYVSGYTGRAISRQRKCLSSRNILVENDEVVSIPNDIPPSAAGFLQAVNRVGLSVPTKYCFGVCGFAVQLYNCLLANDFARSKLLCGKNQRKSFIFAGTKIAVECHTHAVLFQSCDQGHSNFMLMLQIIFNCFAKNELKSINQRSVQPPEKMKPTLTKLNSKTFVQ